MGNNPYECFIGTEVWYRDENRNSHRGIVKKVMNDTFVIRAGTSRFGRDTVNVNIRDVFETQESMFADEYKDWKDEVARCMEQAGSPEKILRVLYAQAVSAQPMSDEMRLAVRKQTKEFFGIELDEEAAFKAKAIEELLWEEG